MNFKMETWSDDLGTDIKANMNGLNEFVSDCLKSENLESLNIFATMNDNTDVKGDERKGDDCADVDSAVVDNVTTSDTTTDDILSDGNPCDCSSSNDADTHDARIDFVEPIEDANATHAGGDEITTEGIPTEDIKETAKEQILTLLDLGAAEEPDTNLGADYGVTIQLPEDEVESVKEENCCHGFKLVVGAVVIYAAIAFYQILATDITDKLREEYSEEVMNDFYLQNQVAWLGDSDYDRTTMTLSSATTTMSHSTSTANHALSPTASSTAYKAPFHSTSGLPRPVHSTSSSSKSTSGTPTTTPRALSRRKRQAATFDQDAFQRNLEDIAKINDVYNKTRALIGLISAILVVLLNYRVVILIGSIINLTALLISMFVRNFQVLIFLLGFCTGVGNNMLFVAMTVAILERFRKYRMMATTISGAILAIGYTAVMLLKAFVFDDVGMTTSKSFQGLLAALYGLCILAAFLVQPLNLKMKDSNDTFIGRALNISGLRLFKAWGIYVLAGVFFFYTYSIETPVSNIDSIVDEDDKQFVELTVRSGSLVSVTLIFIFMGGCCICCRRCECCTRQECCCRRCVNGCFQSIPINRLLIVLAIACAMAAFNCLFVFGLEENIAYVFAYSTILGLATGLADPLLIVAIPALLGEEFVSLGVGVTDFAKGLATVIAGEMAELLLKRSKPKIIFYMGIGTFIMGGVLAILLNRLHRSGLIVPIDSSQEDGRAEGTHDVDVTDKVNRQYEDTNETGGDAIPKYCFVISKDEHDVYTTQRCSQMESA